MKILHMTLKKKWFDMIFFGEKTEEYREIKPYWIKRLSKKYDIIRFKNGYNKDSPWFDVELKEIKEGIGLLRHGAPIYPVFILKLGKITKYQGKEYQNGRFID